VCRGSQGFHKNLHMNMGRLSALSTGRLYTPWKTPSTHFCYRLSRPQGHSAAGMIKSMKHLKDPIGNRAHNLPACSVVPELTALPRTSAAYKVVCKTITSGGGPHSVVFKTRGGHKNSGVARTHERCCAAKRLLTCAATQHLKPVLKLGCRIVLKFFGKCRLTGHNRTHCRLS
jgi:hypothetical protein